MIIQFVDRDGAVSQEVFDKMGDMVSRMLIDELDLMHSCDVVRKRPASVLRLAT